MTNSSAFDGIQHTLLLSLSHSLTLLTSVQLETSFSLSGLLGPLGSVSRPFRGGPRFPVIYILLSAPPVFKISRLLNSSTCPCSIPCSILHVPSSFSLSWNKKSIYNLFEVSFTHVSDSQHF